MQVFYKKYLFLIKKVYICLTKLINHLKQQYENFKLYYNCKNYNSNYYFIDGFTNYFRCIKKRYSNLINEL